MQRDSLLGVQAGAGLLESQATWSVITWIEQERSIEQLIIIKSVQG